MDIELLRKYATAKVVLDSCTTTGKREEKPALDAVDAVSAHALNDAALEAATVIQAWLEEEPEEGETFADTLQDMFFENADMNEDGDLSDDETALVDARLNAAYDYMVAHGAYEEDAYKLLSEWNADAAERVHDLLIAKLPDGEAADKDIDDFVFGPEAEVPVMDSVHKKVVAIRNGKKVRILKKISGPKNMKRVALARKNARKMHSAAARIKRAKSMRIRMARGL